MKSRIDKIIELIRKFDIDLEILSHSQKLSFQLLHMDDHVARKQLRASHLIQKLDLQKALCKALGKLGRKKSVEKR